MNHYPVSIDQFEEINRQLNRMTVEVLNNNYVIELMNGNLPIEIVIDELKRINEGYRPIPVYRDGSIITS